MSKLDKIVTLLKHYISSLGKKINSHHGQEIGTLKSYNRMLLKSAKFAIYG